MPIDPSIALSYKPVQIQDPMEMYGKRQQIQTNALAMQKYQTESAEKNALAQLIGAPNYDPYDPESQAAAFKVAPNLAPGMFKALQETRAAGQDYETKTQTLADARYKAAQTKVADATKEIIRHDTPESVLADLDQRVAKGDLTQDQANAISSSLPKTAADMPKWQISMLRRSLTAAEQLEQNVQTTDLGGKVQTTVRPKFAGGAAPQVTTVSKTATPGDLLTAAAAARQLAQDEAQFNVTTDLERQKLGQKGGDFISKMSKGEQRDYRALVSTGKIIDSALTRIAANEKAFGFGKGAATSFGGVVGGRMGASALASGMTDDEIQARAYVYNVVSAAVKERAGTAQSAQELKVLDGFLPSPFDDARVISAKLKGFKQYLATKRESYEPADGTEGAAPAPAAAPAAPLAPPKLNEVVNGYRYVGGDPTKASSWKKL